MTSFVEILPEEYDKHAFARFDASAANFKLGNARALMWFSQLAYETGLGNPTIDAVALGKWDFTSVTPFTEGKIGVKGSFETCGLDRRTGRCGDPGFRRNRPWRLAKPRNRFYAVAAGRLRHPQRLSCWRRMLPRATWDRAVAALPTEVTESLFSLPATASARHSPRSRPRRLRAPRCRPARFTGSACRASAASDFRQVTMRHSATLPIGWSTATMLWRVCRRCWPGFTTSAVCFECAAGGKFDETRPLSAVGLDEPNLFRRNSRHDRTRHCRAFFRARFALAGPGTFGPLFGFLPTQIRNHLQDSYWKALTP